MAKALYGHVGMAQDRRLVDEVNRLRSRCRHWSSRSRGCVPTTIGSPLPPPKRMIC